MKKRLLCLGLLIVTALSFAACGGKDNNASEEPPYDEPIIGAQTVDEFIENYDRSYEFTDNNVLVLLTEEASFEYIFKDYTAEDFTEVDAISVQELDGRTSDTSGLIYRIRQCLLEDPSGSTIPDHLKHYRRSFCITLDKHDKDNVLRAVFILGQRTDIDSADPNGIERGD